MPCLRLCWCCASCRVLPPSSSGSLPSWSAVTPCPALLPVSPASAGSPAVPVGASKPYSQRASVPCSGLAPLVPEVCLGGVSAIPSFADVPCGSHGGSVVLGPPIGHLLPPSAPCALVTRVVGGGVHPLPAPVRTPSVRPNSLWALQGFLPTASTLSLRGCRRPVTTRSPLPLPDGTPVGFPPLRRPHDPPPLPPLRGTRGPLRRPCGPRHRPALPRFRRSYFPAGLPVAPFAPASRSRLVGGHGGGFPGVAPAGLRFPM